MSERQAQVQTLRQLLTAELGQKGADKFTDAHLEVLLAAGYQDAEDLRDSAKVGSLQSLALPDARKANLQAHFQGQAAGGPSPPQGVGATTELTQKHFAAADVVDLASNYCVEPPPEVETLLKYIKEAGERYLVVCGGRQTGKTNLAYGVARQLAKNAMVYIVQFGTKARDCKTADEFWAHMAEMLVHTAAAKQRSGRFATLHQRPCQEAFIAAMQAATEAEWYLFDEVSSVPELVAEQFVDAFHKVKNTPDILVRGVILYGVHIVKQMLHEYNRGRTKRSAVTAPEDEPPTKRSAVQGVHEFAAAEGSRTASAGTVSFCGAMHRVSPFRADCVLGLQPFTVEHIQQLLTQYTSDRQNQGNACLALEAVPAVANSIHELTSGHKGLTGFCLHQLDLASMHRRPIVTADDWDLFSSTQLLAALIASQVFQTMIDVVGDVFPTRAVDARLKEESPEKWEVLKRQQGVVMSVLYSGHCQVDPTQVEDLYDLFSEGLLVVRPKGTLSGVQLLFSPSLQDPVEVELAAPILQSCVLHRLSTATPPKDPTITKEAILDIMWLLKQVCRGLDLGSLAMEEARLVSGEPSEYALQCQMHLLVPSILMQYKAFKPYSVIGEARRLRSGVSTRRRLDLLLRADSDSLPRYGLELLAHGDKSSIDDHVARAGTYSKLHTVNAASPCMVYAVNFCCHPGEPPQPPTELGKLPVYPPGSPAFDPTTHEPYFPSKVPANVCIVHIIIDRVSLAAHICTRQDTQLAWCRQEIDSMALSGVERVYRRSHGGQPS